MQHAGMLAPTAARLDEYATYLLGPRGSTRGTPLEKYFLPQLCMAASSQGLDGPPQMIFPVWVAELQTPASGRVEVTKTVDGLVSFWNDSDETYLAFEAHRSTDVIALRASGFVASEIVFQKGKGFLRTTVPGISASNGALHFAVGGRNSTSFLPFSERARPYFEKLVARLASR